jgi:hypothetical protein
VGQDPLHRRTQPEPDKHDRNGEDRRGIDEVSHLPVEHLDESDRRHRRQFTRPLGEVDGRHLDLVTALPVKPAGGGRELADLGDLAVDDGLVGLVPEIGDELAPVDQDGDEEFLDGVTIADGRRRLGGPAG